MNLLKNSQTNWKYILIVAILAVIVGGGILGYSRWIKEEVKIPGAEAPEEKVPEEEIIPEKIIVDLEKFNTVEDIIVYYLNQYPNEPNILERVVVEYLPEYKEGKITGKLIKWIEKADLDSDGLEELVICYIDPSEGMSILGFPSAVSVFSKKEQVYKIDFTSKRAFYSSYFIRDMNKDNKLEVVLTADWCGAHTCGNSITTIQFDGQKWRNLTPNVEISYGDIKWEDRDGDGIEEIVLRGGTVGSVGGGMQRKRTDIYAYREGEYRLIKTIGDPSTNIYYLMLDANKALKENNLTDALKLVTQALQNPNSGVSFDEYGYVNERDQVRILSYAAIQAMLVYLRQSPPDLNSVNSLLQEITQKYNKFDNPYINASQILRDTYLATGNVQKACQTMEDEILKAGDNAKFLHWYGYNTEKLDLKDLCP